MTRIFQGGRNSSLRLLTDGSMIRNASQKGGESLHARGLSQASTFASGSRTLVGLQRKAEVEERFGKASYAFKVRRPGL